LHELSLSEKTSDARLVRSLRSRKQKPKIFLTFLFSPFGGGCVGSRQKMEKKFLVLLRLLETPQWATKYSH